MRASRKRTCWYFGQKETDGVRKVAWSNLEAPGSRLTSSTAKAMGDTEKFLAGIASYLGIPFEAIAKTFKGEYRIICHDEPSPEIAIAKRVDAYRADKKPG
jgi:hypothetical protein